MVSLEQLMMQSEAIIFGADRPMSFQDILQMLKDPASEEESVDPERLKHALDAIVEKYASDFYPFEVRQLGGGYQFLSKKSFYPLLSRLNGDKFTRKLSTASMETLAIIAYKQPITKGEIEHIRGVNSDYSVQKLLEKELIVISGRHEDMVGKPLTYNTSKTFMNYLGLNSLEELPKLTEIIGIEQVDPTPGYEALPTTGESASQYVVSSEGELVEIRLETDNDGFNQEQGPEV